MLHALQMGEAFTGAVQFDSALSLESENKGKIRKIQHVHRIRWNHGIQRLSRTDGSCTNVPYRPLSQTIMLCPKRHISETVENLDMKTIFEEDK